MTIPLTILAIGLAVLLLLQRRNHARRLARLSLALETGDRSLLDGGPLQKGSRSRRRLERQIFDQLSEAETLEARVSHRENLLSTVVEGLGDAVIVFDDSLGIRFSNPSAARLFGLEKPANGLPIGEIHDSAFLDLVERAVAKGERCTSELTVRPPDPTDGGGERTLEVEVAPLPRTETGSVNRVRAVLHDVTEARQLDQVRKDFVANASHELRTPLTIINGYLENLVEGGIDDPETAHRFHSVMKTHGDRIARIIEDMLTISKLESGEDLLNRSTFDFRSCTEDVITRLSPIAEAKNAEIALDFPDAPTLVGDPFYWDQVLFNLVENALKENDAPGLKIRIALERAGEWDTVSVTDDGVGIPRATLPFVFKRFYRVDKNRSAEKKGTGLGLSIVKRAIEAHGGTIEAASIPGRATTFTIKVPGGPREPLSENPTKKPESE